MTRQHIPVVRIVTPEPDPTGMTQTVLSRIVIDGSEWAVTGYRIEGEVGDIQKITLTFLADVTVVHGEKP